MPVAPIVETSGLACYTCKRRKVKCNKGLPECSLCVHIGVACDYPTYAEKPGPKLGSVHKHKRKRTGSSLPLSTSSHCSSGHRQGLPSSIAEEPDTCSLLQQQHPQNNRRNSSHTQSTLSEHGITSPTQLSHDGSITVDRVIWNQNAASDNRATAAEKANAPDFSQIMYPSHESQTRPQSPIRGGSIATPKQVTVELVCSGLGISRTMYNTLKKLYFEHMTAFSLFLPHKVEDKFESMTSVTEALALIAAMFVFSARLYPVSEGDVPPEDNLCPQPSYFSNIASKMINDALMECGDTIPPLWLLQASVLDAFYCLTKSVRSRSWRLLGNCIRLAYDLKLHLTDVEWQHYPNAPTSEHQPYEWFLLEERRRCWWAIWEMDVFASTIRCLPTAIDWKQNFVFLPIPDECWFTGTKHPSCFLAQDPGERWKQLSKVKNTSPRAWFIIVNSLMHDAQLLIYNPGTMASKSELSSSHRDELTMISNSRYCVMASMPFELRYNGQLLDFRTKRAVAEANVYQFHSDIYSIHLMSQLTQFMIFHHSICSQEPWASRKYDTNGASPECKTPDPTLWANYMKASEEIVSIVRNSDPNHYQYINPFLNNTLWFAAAAQIACIVFAPACYSRALIRSNYEVVALTIDRLSEFWASMDMLKPRLQKVESALRRLEQNRPNQSANRRNHGDWQHTTSDITSNSTSHNLNNSLHDYTTSDTTLLDNRSDYSENSATQDSSMLAFMPLLQNIDEVTLLSQPPIWGDFEDVFSLGLGDIMS